MYKFLSILVSLIFITTGCKKEKKTVESFEELKIQDPFRQIENLQDSTVILWLKTQKLTVNNELVHSDNYHKFIETLDNNDKSLSNKLYRPKITENKNLFFLKKSNVGNQLYYKEGFEGKETLIYDSKSFSKETNFIINYFQPSWDESKVVVGLSSNDKEFSDLIIIDIQTKKVISGLFKNAWPSSLGGIEWLPTNDGFIYTYVPTTDLSSPNYQLYTEARVVYLNSRKDDHKILLSNKTHPQFKIQPEDFPISYYTSPNNNYLLTAIAGVERYRDTYYQKISKIHSDNVKWNKLYSKEDKVYQFFLFDDIFYFRTSKNASNFKICKTNLNHPNFENPEVLVEEDTIRVISDFAITKDGLYFVKTKNGVESKLYFKNKDSQEVKEIILPKPAGSISISSIGNTNSFLEVKTKGWLNYEETYEYKKSTNQFIEKNLNPVASFDFLEEMIVKEIEVPSHDGTMVPLSIVHHKDTKLDSNNRLLINAYGAYKWIKTPNLNSYLLHWVKNGGIYAEAHVRGGGEKGDAWHKAGYKTTKPNSWKDLISCTKYLQEQGYSQPKNTALWGASAGGITIGRAVTEAPELYAAAVIRVGILNVLRFEFGPNGKNNTKEFGSVENPEEFKALLEMDAYHHIQKGVPYPALYLTAGLNDSRVPAWQPAKFAAKMQECTSSGKPVYLDTDFNGGHGFEASKDKKDIELAKIMAFLFTNTEGPEYSFE